MHCKVSLISDGNQIRCTNHTLMIYPHHPAQLFEVLFFIEDIDESVSVPRDTQVSTVMEVSI